MTAKISPSAAVSPMILSLVRICTTKFGIEAFARASKTPLVAMLRGSR